MAAERWWVRLEARNPWKALKSKRAEEKKRQRRRMSRRSRQRNRRD